MKIIIPVAVASAFTITANAQVHKTISHSSAHTATAQPIHLMNFDDTVSYALGLSIGKFYQQQGIKNLNTGLLTRAIKSVINKDTSLLFTDDQIGDILTTSAQRYAEEKAGKAKHEGEVFLAKNKTNPGVTALPDGLQYEVLQKGTGAIPSDTNNVKVNYVGTLLDGTEFDNSYKRGEPLDIDVAGVIKGWTEALKLMPVGSKWRIWVPSDLGYGDHGAGETIPPGATLQFDIELLGINK